MRECKISEGSYRVNTVYSDVNSNNRYTISMIVYVIYLADITVIYERRIY